MLDEVDLTLYQRTLTLSSVCFLVEPSNFEHHFATLTLLANLPNRIWTDAYLAAFTLAGKSQLVSFDGDFKRFAGLDFLHIKLA